MLIIQMSLLDKIVLVGLSEQSERNRPRTPEAQLG